MVVFSLPIFSEAAFALSASASPCHAGHVSQHQLLFSARYLHGVAAALEGKHQRKLEKMTMLVHYFLFADLLRSSATLSQSLQRALSVLFPAADRGLRIVKGQGQPQVPDFKSSPTPPVSPPDLCPRHPTPSFRLAATSGLISGPLQTSGYLKSYLGSHTLKSK